MLREGFIVRFNHPSYGKIKVRVTEVDYERKRYSGIIERPRSLNGKEVYFDDAAYASTELC